MTTETLIAAEAEANRPAEAHNTQPWRRWAPLLVILAGIFMSVLDFFIVNVALPAMQAGLHASSSSIEWIVAGYSLATAVLLIPASRLGDRFGRRRVFMIGLALFTLSSAACGAAGSAQLLVAARLAQGAGAAMLAPTVLAIIGVLYEGADRPRALAAYGLTMGLAAVSGQLIGGALIAADPAGLGWRACFAINVPIGALALAACRRVVPESRAPALAGFDAPGTALATLALTAIIVPLVEGRAHDWPLWTWLSFGCAPVLGALFWRHERRLAAAGGSPLLPPALLRQRGFVAGVLLQLLFWCGQASFFLYLALYLQLGRGLSPLHSGLVFTILAAAYLMASMRAPALTVAHGRRVLAAGALAVAAGHVALLAALAEVGAGGSIAALIPGLILVGAGMGLGLTPLATLVMASMRAQDVGATTGTLAAMSNVGNALGVTLVGLVFYAAAPHGLGRALELSVAVLAAILLSVAALTRLLPTAQTAPVGS